MNITDLLFRLTSYNAPSGNEGSALDEIEKILLPFGSVERTGLGSLICRSGNVKSGYRILLDAHIDQISMMVTSIKNGFVHVDAVGGIDRRVLLSQPVTIWGSRPVHGVFATTPPHVQKNSDEDFPELCDMAIDTGLGRKAESIINIGDRVTLRCELQHIKNDRVSGKSLDNRAGVAALIRVMELLNSQVPKAEIIMLLSTREETGEQGATTACFNIKCSEAIIVDVSFASQPGLKEHQTGDIGAGPMIGLSPFVDKRISDRLTRIAKNKSIPHQFEVMGGATGTNLDSIMSSRDGVPCGLVSIPLRNMHTAAEIVSVEDIENAAQLINAYIMQGGLQNV